ncbi:hypothetical protein L596_028483 [Steinernema carpocapsae]|uniref:G-protein coupled receptors family 1 profile domain-containing protein n=1 Tax=Steinernema carpocapsae TaxID=34508 RepID=A0A4V6XVN4_STECR|nr:hypothetical protein L596_028483 [Steinernema carpocapsae]
MTNETFFRDGLPRVDPDWIGSYNILVFLMACPANILFLVAIFFEKQMWRMSAYQIIFHMSFVHFILSISTLELGLIALLSRTCLFGDYTVAVS